MNQKFQEFKDKAAAVRRIERLTPLAFDTLKEAVELLFDTIIEIVENESDPFRPTDSSSDSQR